MNQHTVDTIQAILKADPESNTEQIKAILSACKSPTARRKMILAKEAMTILQVSRPTLRKLAKDGYLHPVSSSQRKMRFALAEVENLTYNGMNAVKVEG